MDAHAGCRAGAWACCSCSPIAGAAVVALGLDFDQRYRDYPIWAFAVPAVAFALLQLRASGAAAARQMPIELCFADAAGAVGGFHRS